MVFSMWRMEQGEWWENDVIINHKSSSDDDKKAVSNPCGSEWFLFAKIAFLLFLLLLSHGSGGGAKAGELISAFISPANRGEKREGWDKQGCQSRLGFNYIEHCMHYTIASRETLPTYVYCQQGKIRHGNWTYYLPFPLLSASLATLPRILTN